MFPDHSTGPHRPPLPRHGTVTLPSFFTDADIGAKSPDSSLSAPICACTSTYVCDCVCACVRASVRFAAIASVITEPSITARPFTVKSFGTTIETTHLRIKSYLWNSHPLPPILLASNIWLMGFLTWRKIV